MPVRSFTFPVRRQCRGWSLSASLSLLPVMTAPALFKLAVVTGEQLSACAHPGDGGNIQPAKSPATASGTNRMQKLPVILDPPLNAGLVGIFGRVDPIFVLNSI